MVDSSALEMDVYQRQGFGKRLGIEGQVGLLIVDFVNGFADPTRFGGGNIPPAIASTAQVLQQARALGWPVAHSRIVFAEDSADANIFALKIPELLTLTEGAPTSAIVPQLAPVDGELVVRKTNPSAFHGGPALAAWLTQRGVRTLVVTGCTTSGCVRASVVDAMTLGFRPIVLSDCVGDRALKAHDSSLFDIGQKYGDVITSAELFGQV